MNADFVKRTLWDLVRPLHSPLTRKIRKRFGREYATHPEMELPPAYEAVQFEVERRLHHYLHVDTNRIRQIVLVGANDGAEIPRLRHTYPQSRFLCFEPSPIWHRKLTQQFGRADHVEMRRLALSESAGTATFHEMPMAGNGSLLEPDPAQWSAFNRVEDNRVTSFEVSVSTLDEEAKSLEIIDLLWMDVQGAEGHVLRGGFETLPRVASIFLEVSLLSSPYQGTLLFPQLQAILSDFGFICVGLGIDGSNFSGNALWIKKPR